MKLILTKEDISVLGQGIARSKLRLDTHFTGMTQLIITRMDTIMYQDEKGEIIFKDDNR